MRVAKKSPVNPASVKFPDKSHSMHKHFNYWERQKGATGITYADPELKSISSVPGGRGFKFSVSSTDTEKPHPQNIESYGNQKFTFDRGQSDAPEFSILPYEDHRPISNVGMWSFLHKTEHPGWYLTKK